MILNHICTLPEISPEWRVVIMTHLAAANREVIFSYDAKCMMHSKISI